MRLNLILLDSALELVPREIVSHPAVVKNAVRRGKKAENTLLDISLHYKAMKNLENANKRGRPDIVHFALLLFLTLEEEIRGDLFIHTIDGKIIFVDRQMRPPKNYNRFVGLMEQLLLEGKIPPKGDRTLMEITNLKLKDLSRKYSSLIVLSESGRKVNPADLCKLMHENVLFGVGAFAHGDFSSEVKESASDFLSISKNVLETHQVICRVSIACSGFLS
ncbi:16S rRNA methyltransferase [Sulfolobus acidocaldarius]|uniref:Ribosomal RNA small subunit methyltransferase Nep1 n=1 Tax=Sulfolobus acidocaldarius (strain ATCC 33909 / DSM 639 / JCM 8929 / NBRC 15157 / NCIMB 11770) TaxID=330779 RepID=Q4JCL5_SULAC|nr:16S rRNA methyltransferase [Sulfolobus acidocaldarius]AAY79464.1 conserved protein [Sulfolobus acidocaldarius DSM 639]WCM34046.1 16S rRNA methyltransferase [Sulfolobus acidocaldarius DSM 639]